MSTTDNEGNPRIKNLADLARFVAPDDPMSVVDALFQMRQGVVAAGGAIAQAHPHAYAAFTAWDRLDYYPTAADLAELVEHAKDEPPPLFEAFGAKPYALEGPARGRPGDPLTEWIEDTVNDGPPIGVLRCDDVEEQCKGVRLITGSHERPGQWVETHLSPPTVTRLVYLMHEAMHGRPWQG